MNSQTQVQIIATYEVSKNSIDWYDLQLNPNASLSLLQTHTVNSNYIPTPKDYLQPEELSNNMVKKFITDKDIEEQTHYHHFCEKNDKYKNILSEYYLELFHKNNSKHWNEYQETEEKKRLSNIELQKQYIINENEETRIMESKINEINENYTEQLMKLKLSRKTEIHKIKYPFGVDDNGRIVDVEDIENLEE